MHDMGIAGCQNIISINSISFKLTETKQGVYEGVCLNPKDIPANIVGVFRTLTTKSTLVIYYAIIDSYLPEFFFQN
jgi:hypothetical protein